MGVVQHGESHSAEHAGGETVSVAITTVLSRRSAWRASLQILQRQKTKNIHIAVKVLGMCMRRRWGAEALNFVAVFDGQYSTDKLRE